MLVKVEVVDNILKVSDVFYKTLSTDFDVFVKNVKELSCNKKQFFRFMSILSREYLSYFETCPNCTVDINSNQTELTVNFKLRHYNNTTLTITPVDDIMDIFKTVSNIN